MGRQVLHQAAQGKPFGCTRDFCNTELVNILESKWILAQPSIVRMATRSLPLIQQVLSVVSDEVLLYQQSPHSGIQSPNRSTTRWPESGETADKMR